MRGNEGDNLPPQGAWIWERRHHDGVLGGGGGLPAELRAAVVTSWAAVASFSGLGAELKQRRARFGGMRAGAAGDLRSPSHGEHMPPLPLCAWEGDLLEIVLGKTAKASYATLPLTYSMAAFYAPAAVAVAPQATLTPLTSTRKQHIAMCHTPSLARGGRGPSGGSHPRERGVEYLAAEFVAHDVVFEPMDSSCGIKMALENDNSATNNATQKIGNTYNFNRYQKCVFIFYQSLPASIILFLLSIA
jgi:hypothetical protein